MITVRAASSVTRPRRPVGPLRLLWLAALLFTFLYTHAAGADSASAHVAGTTAAHLSVSTDVDGGHSRDGRTSDGHGEGHGESHPAESCVSGHPQQGCELPGPHPVPLAERSPAFAEVWPQSWSRTGSSGLPSLQSSLGSVVQRV